MIHTFADMTSATIAVGAIMAGAFYAMNLVPIGVGLGLGVAAIGYVLGFAATGHINRTNPRALDQLRQIDGNVCYTQANLTYCDLDFSVMKRDPDVINMIDYFNISRMLSVTDGRNLTSHYGMAHNGVANVTMFAPYTTGLGNWLELLKQQASDECHGDCYLDSLAGNTTKRSEQPFTPDWACYNHEAGPHEDSSFPSDMNIFEAAFKQGWADDELGYALNDFANQYHHWKACIGFDAGTVYGFDGIPGRQLLRGELYYNTCGGIDGQCGTDYAGADDYSV